MSRDGGEVTCLTHNQHVDLYPRWAPRKDGVGVSLASAVIRGASSLADVEGQPLEFVAGKAVGWIGTGDGTGSKLWMAGYPAAGAELVLTQGIISAF